MREKWAGQQLVVVVWSPPTRRTPPVLLSRRVQQLKEEIVEKERNELSVDYLLPWTSGRNHVRLWSVKCCCCFFQIEFKF